MLSRMTTDISSKVVIVDQCTDRKFMDYLMLKKIINQKIVHITGQDSYERRLKISPESRVHFDAIAIIPRSNDLNNLSLEDNAFFLPLPLEGEKSILNISSTKVRANLATRTIDDIQLNSSVLSYILEHNLYKTIPESKHSFEHEYYAYIGKNILNSPLPTFDPQSSTESWEENFYTWVFVQNKAKRP
jgi:hypothetical protein